MIYLLNLEDKMGLGPLKKGQANDTVTKRAFASASC